MWLIDMTDLLKAARIPDENQVEMAKIQLKAISRTWWLAEEMRLDKPISQDQFSKSFYERFFPTLAKKEIEEQFIRLHQWNWSVDKYAAEFLRLSVISALHGGRRGESGQQISAGPEDGHSDVLMPQKLKTYSQVLTITHDIE